MRAMDGVYELEGVAMNRFGLSGDPQVFAQRPSTGQYCRMDRVGLLVRPFTGNPVTASLASCVEVKGFGDMLEGIEV